MPVVAVIVQLHRAKSCERYSPLYKGTSKSSQDIVQQAKKIMGRCKKNSWMVDRLCCV
jgi:hypothetical protein